jgi:hypothetical protein
VRYAIGGPAAAADRTAAASIAGTDRFDTSVRVARRFFSRPAAVGVATGRQFPDALAGGTHIALRGGPMLLTDPDALPATVRDYLAANKTTITTSYFYGGPAATSQAVAEAIQAVLTTTPATP